MEAPRIEEGGFRLTESQLAQLEAAGYPLNNPVEFIPPQTIEEFRKIQVNNFTVYFWYNYPLHPLRFQQYEYFRVGVPCFERLRTLFPDFVEGTHHIVESFLPIDADIKMHPGDGKFYTRTEHERFYTELVEPRLFVAWVAMGQLFDENDENYQKYLRESSNVTPAGAIYDALAL